MTDVSAAEAGAPDPRVITVDGEHAAALRRAAAKMLGVPVDEVPSAADLIAAITSAGPPPPLTEQQLAQAVGSLRGQAQADYEQAQAAADDEEERASSALEHARQMRGKAEDDRARALAVADALEQGEPPPLWEPQPAGDGETAEPGPQTAANGTGA